MCESSFIANLMTYTASENKWFNRHFNSLGYHLYMYNSLETRLAGLRVVYSPKPMMHIVYFPYFHKMYKLNSPLFRQTGVNPGGWGSRPPDFGQGVVKH